MAWCFTIATVRLGLALRSKSSEIPVSLSRGCCANSTSTSHRQWSRAGRRHWLRIGDDDVPIKKRIDKRRRDLPSETITRLLEAQPIEFSEAAREVLVAAVYLRDPALPA